MPGGSELCADRISPNGLAEGKPKSPSSFDEKVNSDRNANGWLGGRKAARSGDTCFHHAADRFLTAGNVNRTATDGQVGTHGPPLLSKVEQQFSNRRMLGGRTSLFIESATIFGRLSRSQREGISIPPVGGLDTQIVAQMPAEHPLKCWPVFRFVEGNRRGRSGNDRAPVGR